MANKMYGISVALPLQYDSIDGPYRLNKTLKDVVKQNLKTLILTSPGERIMIPDFGAGLRDLFFEPYTPNTFSTAKSRITSQISRYMPFVNVTNFTVITSEDDPDLTANGVRMILQYNIGSIDDSDTLIITQAND
jgi:phage baseplate assembly protein W